MSYYGTSVGCGVHCLVRFVRTSRDAWPGADRPRQEAPRLAKGAGHRSGRLRPAGGIRRPGVEHVRQETLSRCPVPCRGRVLRHGGPRAGRLPVLHGSGSEDARIPA
jgi:hypothetical protein